MFAYLAIFCIIFAYSIQIADNKNGIDQGVQDYYVCLVRGLECSLSDSVSNYNLIMLKGFSISSLGFFLFAIFSSSLEIVRFWYLCVQAICLFVVKWDRRHWNRVVQLVTKGSGVTTVTDSNTLTVGPNVEIEDNDDGGETSSSGSASSRELEPVDGDSDDDDDDEAETASGGGVPEAVGGSATHESALDAKNVDC